MDYLMAFGDAPGMDEPLPAAPAAPYADPRQGYPAAAGNGGPAGYGAVPPGYGPPQPPMPPSPSPYPSILPGASYAAQALGAMSLAAPQPYGQQYAPPPAYPPPPPGAYPQQQQPYPPAMHQAPPAGAGAATFYNPYAPQPGPGGTHTAAGSAQGSGGGGDARLMVGVAGIVQREQAKVEESGKALEGAMHDLSALMARAADMVALAQRFRGVMAAGQVEGEGAPKHTPCMHPCLPPCTSQGIRPCR